MGDSILDTNPTSPATQLAVKRTDLFGDPSQLTLAEVSMFGAGTTSQQGVIVMRTRNPGTSTAGLVDCMRIHTNGFVGIGVPAPTPTQALEVAGTVRATAFQGPVDGRNVAADGANLDAHRTNTSNPHSTTAAQVGALAVTGGTVSGNLTVTGTTTTTGDIVAGNSAIYFTQTSHNHTGIGNTAGNAAIENAVSHDALMILGRAGTAKGRCVKLWDYLQVNGPLDVTGNVSYSQLTKLDVADNFGATIRAADLNFGHSSRRGSPGRALVDLTSALVVNFGPDWSDCIIGSQLHVNGNYSFVQGAGGEQAYMGGDGWGNDVQVGSANYWVSNMSAYNTASGTYMNMYARSFISTSDVRDKDEIEDVSGALDKLLRLRGVSFRWKEKAPEKAPEQPKEKPKEKKTKEIGLIAQEVQAVCPEAVSEGRNGHLSLSYSSITALLVEAVKEQAAQIKELKQKISDLEKKH